jgi:Ca2+-binding EF-hand superfamily protein/uncharacterized SAM-binding protein YcdF (DUF218 family)
LAKLDVDKDGNICKSEAFMVPEVAARFPDIDTNKDGLLNVGSETDGYVSLDADTDGFITKAEAADNAFVNGKFDAWDMDKDGKLSDNELLWAALDRDGDNKLTKVDALSFPQVAVEFDHMDRNHDGFVDFEEFNKRFEDADTNNDGVVTKEEAKATDDDDTPDHVEEDEFDIIDKNGDGKLENHEMIHDVLDNSAYDRGTPPMYQELDKDVDDFISEDEAAKDAQLKAHFKTLDKDSDGKLSHAELLSVLDTNGDGEISVAESMKFPELAAQFSKFDSAGKGHATPSELGSFKSVDLGDGYISKEEAKGNSFFDDPTFGIIDADSDGRLSPFELKVHALDKNDDNKISPEEAMMYPELAARFPDLDKDGDNQLTIGEFSAFKSLDKNGNGRVSHREADDDKYVREHFRKWDTNSMNRLSDSDFKLAALGLPTVDTDGDGEISQAEKDAADAKYAYLKDHFSEMDKDNDGKLSKQEILFWSLDIDHDQELSEGEVLVAHPELAALFRLKDTNKDNKLTWDEFKDHVPVDTNGDGIVTQDEVDAHPDQSVKDELDKMDKNNDGKIETHEMIHHALDDNGDGKVDRNEAAGDPAVINHFDAADDDDDGLDADELRSTYLAQDMDGSGLVSKVEAFAADPEVAARFEDLDKDGDGFLTVDEMKGYESLDEAQDESITRVEADKDPYVKGKFDDWDVKKDEELSVTELMIAALDTDGDHRVSKKESMALSWELGARFRFFAENDGSLKLSSAEFERYRSLDHNLDGYITKAEASDDADVTQEFDEWDIFVKDGKLQQEELLAAALRKDLSRLDQFSLDADGNMVQNKDGKISKHEARVGDPEVAMRFDTLDTDKDGYLSQDEYKGYSTLDENYDGCISKYEANHDAFNTFSPAKYVSDQFDTLDTNSDGKLDEEEMLGSPDWTFTMGGVYYDKLQNDAATVDLAKTETSKTVAGALGVDQNKVTSMFKAGSARRLQESDGSGRRLASVDKIDISFWLDDGKSELEGKKGDIQTKLCHLFWVPSSDVLKKIGTSYSTGTPVSPCPDLATMKSDVQGGTMGTASADDAGMGTASASDAGEGSGSGKFLGLRFREWVQLVLLLLATINFVYFWCIWKPAPVTKLPAGLFDDEEEVAVQPLIQNNSSSQVLASARTTSVRSNVFDFITPDAIIVLGGGLQNDGSLQPWVQQRLTRAKDVYTKAKHQKASAPKVITMNEGIRNTLRDPRGGAVASAAGSKQVDLESQLAKRFIEKLGVPATDIIPDNHSLDLIGNAYFPRTSNTFKTAMPEVGNLCIITNKFHMARAKEIFKTIMNLPLNKDDGPLEQPFNLMFEEVGDERVADESLKTRNAWEKDMLKVFREHSKKWNDLRDVYAHIFPSASPDRPLRSLTSEDLAGDPYFEGHQAEAPVPDNNASNQ